MRTLPLLSLSWREWLQVEIFPNPASEVLFVGFDPAHSGDVTIVVYDNLGRSSLSAVHLTMEGNQSVFSISIKSLQSGLHYVQLVTERGMIVRPLIIQ